jgi:hypothetical protein
MLPITENENENFELLSDEISDIPGLEALNSNDRRLFDVFLEFWNVSVYPKFVMLAQQGSKNGAGKAVDLVRRTKYVIDLYNQKIKNYQNYHSSDIDFEFQQQFSSVCSYFDSIAERRQKLTRSELDIFAEKIAGFDGAIHPPKKMSRGAAASHKTQTVGAQDEKKATPAAEFVRNQSQPQYRPQAQPQPQEQYQYQPPRPTYFNESSVPGRHSSKKIEPMNFSIPIGLFFFFAGAGIAGPVGAAIGLALGLLIASRSENESRGIGSYKAPPSEEVLNDLKNAESDLNQGPPPGNPAGDPYPDYDKTVAQPAEAKNESGCALGCFITFICMVIGANASEGSGVAAGLFVGFFLSSLITDLMNRNYKNIEGGFTINGFFMGLVFGMYFDHVFLGIIFGIFASRVLFSLLVGSAKTRS